MDQPQRLCPIPLWITTTMQRTVSRAMVVSTTAWTQVRRYGRVYPGTVGIADAGAPPWQCHGTALNPKS